MHEVGLMSSVLALIKDDAAQRGIARVYKVKLVIGRLTMALPASLQFAFDALAREELFAEAVLEMEERGIVCRCSSCREEFTVDRDYCFACPRCREPRCEIVSGRDLFIDYYEGE